MHCARLLRTTLAAAWAPTVFFAALLSISQPTLAQFTQQGPKLVGTGVAGTFADQGNSVALSGDGNTAIVGGYADNYVGAPPPCPCALGAAWVYTRSGGVWTQQGSKLFGSGAVGPAVQRGSSVSLSADGNTAIVGGDEDNSGAGAAWVFTRSNGVWSQQGSKLVGTGAVGPLPTEQGLSVALSGDGNTAIVGGPLDNNQIGAAWVYTQSGGVWTQQGAKLVGTGGVGTPTQGWSVSLSADGNTAIVGGYGDNGDVGAVWVYTRSGGVWTQQGSKLVGTGAAGNAAQGYSVGLSADGSTATVGGFHDNGNAGAAWVFVQPPAKADKTNTHDFNGDGKADLLWRDTSGDAAIWLMNGAQPIQSAGLATVPTAWTIVGQRDFSGDGKADLLWRNTTTGDVAIWFMNGVQVTQFAGVATVPTAWSIVGTGDFNGDGKADLLWQNTTTGDVAIWLMNGAQVLQSSGVATVPTVWTIVGTGDFNGDGKSDILWQNTTTGDVAIWLMNGAQVTQFAGVATVPTAWTIVGTGDFYGDGKSDILWRDTSGDVAIWLMNGAQVIQSSGVATVPTTWTIVETGDFDGDGKSDILWHNTSGNVAIWFMNGTQVTQFAGVATVPTVWSIQGANAD
jgi:hypothetical protein